MDARKIEFSMRPETIFALTYLVLAIGRLPGSRIDRTGAAIVGASLRVGVNALTLQQAQQSINYCPPFASHLANPMQTRLMVALSSTPAGNLTVLASVANLIVIHGPAAK